MKTGHSSILEPIQKLSEIRNILARGRHSPWFPDRFLISSAVVGLIVSVLSLQPTAASPPETARPGQESSPASEVVVTHGGDEITIGNRFLARVFDISFGYPRTMRIVDRRSGRASEVGACEEFIIHLMDGSKVPASAMTLKSWKTVDLAGENGGGKEIVFDLEGPSTDGRDKGAWRVRLHVAMEADDWFLRKWLEISRTTPDSVAVDRIDIEAVELTGPFRDFPTIDFSHPEDSVQRIYAKWAPWLGQPVFADAFFFGVEFPASDNHVRLRLEAEDAVLDGYKKNHSSFRSGQAVINTSDMGTATMRFEGRAGNYDVAVGYLRRHQGDGGLKVRLNGVDVDQWQWDKGTYKFSWPLPKHRIVARAIALRPGDVIQIEGHGSDAEGAAVDYVDFVPADATVGRVVAGYDWGRSIGAETYRTHSSVCGAGESPEAVRDAFLEYIRVIRAHSPRLQVQYNTWYDTGEPRLNIETFTSSVEIMSEKLARRGVKPLDCYMLDYGWGNNKGGPWKADQTRFPGGLGDAQRIAEAGGSNLGLWFSPGGFYGSGAGLTELGYKALDAGRGKQTVVCPVATRYSHDIRQRLLQLMDEHRVKSWKLDGWAHGASSCEDPSHGHPTGKNGKYYYTALAETWLDTVGAMRKRDPDVFINITCLTWLSPWFLQHVDMVWMNNANDQGWLGEGGDRDRQLTYRDSRVYNNVRANGFPFPLWGMFHMDPIKGRLGALFTGELIPHTTDETSEEFRRSMYMVLARGSGLVDMYFAPSVLTEKEWDSVAESLAWAHANFDALDRARIIGGDPAEGAVYGYSGWTAQRGVVVLRNPSSTPKTFECALDRSIGVELGSGPFRRKSVLATDEAESGRFAHGERVSVTLPPFGVVVWEFTPHPQ